MADPADVQANKMVRREFSRRMLDMTRADIRVTHGVCYIRGSIGPIRGGPTDVKAEVELVARLLRQVAGVKDVIIDCTIRS